MGDKSFRVARSFLSQSIPLAGVKSPHGSRRSRAFSPFVLVPACDSLDMNPHQSPASRFIEANLHTIPFNKQAYGIGIRFLTHPYV